MRGFAIELFQCGAALTFMSAMMRALYDMKSALVRLAIERGRGIVTGMVRMMRPGRADITQIRSDNRIASSISWVTNNTVVPSDCQTSSNNCCMDSRVC